MTTATVLPTATTPIPFSRLFRVEFRKAWDTRASFWLLATIGIVVAGAELIAAIVTGAKNTEMSWDDFSAVAAFIASALLPVLGIMLVTSEWSQRSAMVTFALEPRRGHIVTAKLIVGLVLTLATAIMAIGVGAVANVIHGALATQGADWTFGWGHVLGFVINCSLSMISGFALACLFLNTAAAIVVFFLYKYMLPALFAIGSALMSWFDKVSPYFDFQQAQAPIYDWNLSASDWRHLIVSGLIWLGIPLVFGVRRILRAEVK